MVRFFGLALIAAHWEGMKSVALTGFSGLPMLKLTVAAIS